jgi:HSP20 family protein
MRHLSPFQNRQDFFGDFDKLVDSFFNANEKRWENFPSFNPKVDITENKDYFLITADLPGLSEKDVKVEIDNGVLTIHGERHFENKEEVKGKVNRLERGYGKFLRSFTLPEKIDLQNIEARTEHGVFEIYIPRIQEEEKKTLKIEAKSGGLFSKKSESTNKVN